MSRNFDLFQQVDQLQSRSARAVARTAEIDSPRISIGNGVRAEIAKLVHRLFMSSASCARMVAFVGLDRDAAGSVVCSQAADVLASSISGSVCLLDTDVSRPTLHEIFGVNNSRGFRDFVDGSALMDVAHAVNHNGNLWVVTCENPGRSDDKPLHSARIQPKMMDLRTQFDYVLICSPPPDSHTDVASLVALADGIVLMIRASSTRRETARHVRDEFHGMGVPVLGAVLVDRVFPIPEAIYARL